MAASRKRNNFLCPMCRTDCTGFVKLQISFENAPGVDSVILHKRRADEAETMVAKIEKGKTQPAQSLLHHSSQDSQIPKFATVTPPPP